MRYGVSRVALLSRLPFKPVQLCQHEGRGRQASALIDVATESGTDTLLCVAAYLQSGQRAVAEAQPHDVLAEVDYSGRKALVFGDFSVALPLRAMMQPGGRSCRAQVRWLMAADDAVSITALH